MAEWFGRITANAKVVNSGRSPRFDPVAPYDTVESKGRQMKHC
jgi:hypothetical protein